MPCGKEVARMEEDFGMIRAAGIVVCEEETHLWTAGWGTRLWIVWRRGEM
jgi:hypothetical protein